MFIEYLATEICQR